MDFDYDEISSVVYEITSDAFKYATHILCVIDQTIIA